MFSVYVMIQDVRASSVVLDALRESLYTHSLAHRARHETGEISPIPLETLQQALENRTFSHFTPLLDALTSIEKIPRPFLNLGFKTVAAYHFFGITGIVFACLFPLLISFMLNESVWTTVILLTASAAITWAYIKVTILITKKDAVVFFNYFLALLAGAIIILRILNQPVLIYMDIIILGAGLLFAFGRIGCFMAGCCYGKPSLIGVRYNKFHRKNGFPHAFLSVRLIPIQLIESAWLFTGTAICTYLVLTSQTPGIALCTFLLLVAIGRFVFEFYRGDPLRPYRLGLSKAQWTSTSMLLIISLLQTAGILPFQLWQSFILASFLILLMTLVVRSTNISLSSLYSARHLHEIAKLFQVLKKGSLIPASTRKAVHVKRTSQNIQLSENRIPIKDRTALHHITFSSIEKRFRYREAAGLARHLMGWYKQPGVHVLLSDNDNTFHLIHFTIDTH